VTPPSKLHRSARAVAASTSRARQESVPIKKAVPTTKDAAAKNAANKTTANKTTAKKATAKKAQLKSVDSAPATQAAPPPPVVEDEPVVNNDVTLTAEPDVPDADVAEPEAVEEV